jgi:hypothetical protein
MEQYGVVGTMDLLNEVERNKGKILYETQSYRNN